MADNVLSGEGWKMSKGILEIKPGLSRYTGMACNNRRSIHLNLFVSNEFKSKTVILFALLYKRTEQKWL